MMPTNEYVEVRNGGYYVAGTRIGLDVVVYDFRDGRSAEAIFEAYHDRAFRERATRKVREAKLSFRL